MEIREHDNPRPPIRELCAKATKGPWIFHANTELKNIRALGHDIAKPLRGKLSAYEMEANAELIARLDPQTVLMVVERLEMAAMSFTALAVSTTLSKDSRSLCAQRREEMNAALRALNGQRDGGVE